MGREEQQEEREVLDSIFPEEITSFSDHEFDVLIPLELPSTKRNEPPPQISILLHIRYPEDYPDVGPDLEVRRPAGSTQRSALFDVDNDGAQLLGTVQAAVEENLGMAMVFTLISTLKEAAETLFTERATPKKTVEDVRKPAGSELLADGRVKSRPITGRGTPITEEVFMKWRIEYRETLRKERLTAKQAEEEELRKKLGKSGREEKKLTGREILERGLAHADIEVDDIEIDVDGMKIKEEDDE